ncbi:glycogenin, partial [Metarhizium brunneum ARSEF 3297]
MSAADPATGEQLYATLLLSDSYLPGALVLAHSLRDAGTSKRLAVLVTLDSVSAEAITQLKTVYDYVLPVPRIRNEQPANLRLMNRSDLHSAFTKINLWKQTQFSRIVYIDADIVAYRAPDELFELPHAFSAAPDIGWPDLVNTGVMVLVPNMGDYYAMLAMADRGISFDGADQGLINMHFKHSLNRLSFTYNVTPSAHYQYVPAYRHFQSSISMVHFIGANKPWFSGRNASHGDTPFDEMVGRWWAVYDRHYRAQESAVQPSYRQTSGQRPSQGIVDSTLASAYPSTKLPSGSDEAKNTSQAYIEQRAGEYSPRQTSHDRSNIDASYSPQPIRPAHDEGGTATEMSTDSHGLVHVETPRDSAAQNQRQLPPLAMASWDAQRHPPPPGSKPEAIDFPSTHYEMSRDPAPFIPPVRYPSPPKNMWYEIPKEPPSPSTKIPRQIFPWEARQSAPSRSFTTPAADEPFGKPKAGESDEQYQEPTPAEAFDTLPGQFATGLSGSDVADRNTTASKVGAVSPAPAPGDPWSSYSRVNAWDDVPEISRYVDGLQRHRRTGSQTRGGTMATVLRPAVSGEALQIPKAFKVTDFPTELERPSLPVTPAPIRRPSRWESHNEPFNSAENAQFLPTAEGVPSQSEWVCVHGRRWGPADCRCDLADVGLPYKDPAAQLQLLAQQQSEALLRKLSGDDGVPGKMASHEIPSRPLPFGSEPGQSPTYVTRSAPTSVLSPQPIRGKSPTAVLVADLTGRNDASPESTTKEGNSASFLGQKIDKTGSA